jgi:formate dehydrogenase subunit gamma
MTLVHLYLGAFHPRMTEALKSMIKGTVSVEYAKSHHGKWYKEVVGSEAAAKQTPGGQEQKQAH